MDMRSRYCIVVHNQEKKKTPNRRIEQLIRRMEYVAGNNIPHPQLIDARENRKSSRCCIKIAINRISQLLLSALAWKKIFSQLSNVVKIPYCVREISIKNFDSNMTSSDYGRPMLPPRAVPGFVMSNAW